MENLISDKKGLIIHNCSSDKIEVLLHNEKKAITIEEKSTSIVSAYSDNISLTVKEYHDENYKKLKISEAVLGSIVSVPLLLINCLRFETVDKSIKLPVNFSLPHLKVKNEIIINNSAEPLKSYSLTLNGESVIGETAYSSDETERQVKEYYKSFAASLIFPIIFFVAFIVLSIYLKSVVSMVVFLCTLFLFSFCILNIYRKNKKVIKNIYEHKNTGNG